MKHALFCCALFPRYMPWMIIVMLWLPTVGLGQSPFAIDVGEEEYVMGPVGTPLDSPFFSIKSGSGVRAYSANSDTWTYSGPDLNSLGAPSIGLRRGAPGNFDECGAWLYSALPFPGNKIGGWYSAEHACNYSTGNTVGSIGYAESADGGSTWSKPNYPANQVLSADVNLASDPTRNGAGGGHVIRIGDWLYLFYRPTSDWMVHVARSSAKGQGRPGTWFKFYNGGFSEPGLGGRSTSPDPNLVAANVVYDSYLGQYLAIDFSGRWGAYLSYTNGLDVLKWRKLSYSLLPSVSYSDDPGVDRWWGRVSTDKALYGYPAIVGLDGSSETIGQSFYLYYVKVFGGGDFSNRYQFRRKLTLTVPGTSNYPVKMALVQYARPQGGPLKLSIDSPAPGEGFSSVGLVGYVLPYPQDGFIPAYECFSFSSHSYFLSTGNPERFGWSNCESTADTYVRRIGWISLTPTENANTPLYRCLDPKSGDISTSTHSDCRGNVADAVLGYLLRSGPSIY